MVLDVGFEFRDRGSIPSECQTPRDVDIGQVNFTIASVVSSQISNALLRRSPSLSIYKITHIVHEILNENK